MNTSNTVTNSITADYKALVDSRTIIRRKRFLSRIYKEWYEYFKRNIPDVEGSILELGSGGGFCKEIIPDLIASDCIILPWLDAALDGCQLPFKNKSLCAIICIDVIHHMSDPAAFFREAERCLVKGGAILLVEPWVSAWSSFIYSRFHHEPFDPGAVSWKSAVTGPLEGANGALAWIMFERDRNLFLKLFGGLSLDFVKPGMPFRYLFSGGMGKRWSAPALLYPLISLVEKIISPICRYTAMFASIRIIRKQDVS
jgi:SAM-dependent methyltransferase